MANPLEPNFEALMTLKQLHDATAPAREAAQRLQDAIGLIPKEVPDNETAQRLIAEAQLGADWLQEDFKQTAEWRREKAAEYSDDPRNAEAATLLDHLAATVEDVHLSKLRQYFALFDGDDQTKAERKNDALREVGLYYVPKDAEDFLTDFLAKERP